MAEKFKYPKSTNIWNSVHPYYTGYDQGQPIIPNCIKNPRGLVLLPVPVSLPEPVLDAVSTDTGTISGILTSESAGETISGENTNKIVQIQISNPNLSTTISSSSSKLNLVVSLRNLTEGEVAYHTTSKVVKKEASQMPRGVLKNTGMDTTSIPDNKGIDNSNTTPIYIPLSQMWDGDFNELCFTKATSTSADEQMEIQQTNNSEACNMLTPCVAQALFGEHYIQNSVQKEMNCNFKPKMLTTTQRYSNLSHPSIRGSACSISASTIKCVDPDANTNNQNETPYLELSTEVLFSDPPRLSPRFLQSLPFHATYENPLGLGSSQTEEVTAEAGDAGIISPQLLLVEDQYDWSSTCPLQDTSTNILIQEYPSSVAFGPISTNMALVHGLMTSNNPIRKLHPFQIKALEEIMSGKDIVMEGDRCFGKSTAAIAAVLNLVDRNSDYPEIIYLVSSNKSAQRIHWKINEFGVRVRTKNHLCDHLNQNRDARHKGSFGNIIVGTPPNVYKILNSNCPRIFTKFDRGAVQLVVFDKLDDMLSKGFENDIYNVLYHKASGNTQIVVISRCITPKASVLIEAVTCTPIKITVTNHSPRTKDMSLIPYQVVPQSVDAAFAQT